VGRVLHTEAFEAILAARNILKKDIAQEAGVTASFLADLLAHRGGASPEKADAIAAALGVKVAALFPEVAGWVSPIPQRDGKREAA
jgi:transcriptional regulator with XRE-family HTH domain